MNIAILLTTFNRKNITTECLKQIYSQEILKTEYSVDIYLTDDNSNDGTYETIKKLFPSIYIFKSLGNLYWGRGMLNSWQKAIENKAYDAYIWVNDDNTFFKNAFTELFKCSIANKWDSIICGCFCSQDHKFTYGGYDEKHNPIIPNGHMQKIKYMNGNFVLIPQSIVNKIGLIDEHFHHIGGDFDYGLTAQKYGFNIYSTTCYIGISERNPLGDNRGRITGHKIMQRLHDLYYCPLIENPPQKWYENRKHGKSYLKCILSFVKMHILTLLPDYLYYKIKSYKKTHNEIHICKQKN